MSVLQEKVSKDNDSNTTPSITTPITPGSDIPDGGLTAWLQVIGVFFLFFNSWGIVNMFGAFQTYYEGTLSSMASAISWIGSIQGFLLLIIGMLMGPIFDMGYFRTLLAVGSFLTVFGMMMTSISTKYYQIFLAQGVCVGLGSGCLFIPSVAIVATYFSKKHSFAVGLAASSSSLGGVIYPAVFHQLQPKIGFGWVTRVIAFIALATLGICLVTMKRRVTPAARQKLLDMQAWKEIPYTLFTIGEFLGFLGLYIPFFYISSYALKKTHASEELAFYFVPILNTASLFGRIIPNFLADKTSPLNMLIPCSLISAILALCWITIDDVAGLAVFCILYGFFSGMFVSLPPSTVVSLSPDLKQVGTHMGMSFSFAGLGLLIGNPITGTIINLDTGDFVKAQIFCGVVVGAAAVVMTFARIAKVGPSLIAMA
ncbi:hypothetical protein PILCRDRAFT_78516 [Piloderma croceum F 1598]|uniref:Major facilitator superfamily (MFS) profile domain-containing protein n=1 Tax=Piloderma croceum (strain F 1598) TaxID=765440 RepID=A0A0C3F7I9_PILCF|nr:hypothetical protein PILCRDRAFT_78516 [Piloderma croceum F 1598]